MATAPKKTDLRPDVRGAMSNEEDPRARAARRAAEVRGHLGDMDDGTNEFPLPPSPEGWTYEWKRKSVMGQEDPAHMTDLLRKGWEPVPASRHPEMMPSGNTYESVERKGMVLMERPTELVEEARMIERRRAMSQVRAKEAQLAGTPDGTMSRDDPRVSPKIKKGYEPMQIPD
jgi:hypothetical protein